MCASAPHVYMYVKVNIVSRGGHWVSSFVTLLLIFFVTHLSLYLKRSVVVEQLSGTLLESASLCTQTAGLQPCMAFMWLGDLNSRLHT